MLFPGFRASGKPATPSAAPPGSGTVHLVGQPPGISNPERKVNRVFTTAKKKAVALAILVALGGGATAATAQAAAPTGQQLTAYRQDAQGQGIPWGTVVKFLKATGLWKSLVQAAKNGRDAFLNLYHTLPNRIITKLHEWEIDAEKLFDMINSLSG
ncbi:hypothetical protein ACFV23_18175 [Streptomyces sp. NPDC059627]